MSCSKLLRRPAIALVRPYLALLVVVLSAANAYAEAPRRLTTDGSEKRDPVVGENGKASVFTLLRRPDQWCLVHLSLADLSTRRFHPMVNNSEYDASFSADERVYAYLHNDGNLRTKVMIKDTREGTTVVHDPKGGFVGVENVLSL